MENNNAHLPFSVLKQKLAKKLIDIPTASECSVCKDNNWSFVDQFLVVPSIMNATYPPAQMACLGMICNRCGNIRMFVIDKI